MYGHLTTLMVVLQFIHVIIRCQGTVGIVFRQLYLCMNLQQFRLSLTTPGNTV